MHTGPIEWGHSAAGDWEDPEMTELFATRRHKLLAGAALFALSFGVAAPAAAQDQPPADAVDAADEAAQDNSANPASPPNAQSAEAGEGEEIVVTGFRASLENAVAEKKERDQIVESISAEDIGKLPDASIAESIARLPGLTSQRLSGRANVISIRGFGPDFSTTLLNGREQTSTGDNRGVEFDQYPSEVVRQVVVYKSPTASLVGQGLVGTVDIRTVRPLDFGGKQVLAVGGRVSHTDLGKLNAGSKDIGYRANVTFVDQFADDTLGLAIAASYVDEPYQIQEFNAWGYNTVGLNGGPAALIGGSKSYVTSTQLKRLGFQTTGQYRPSPELTFTLDGFYSNFEDDQIKRGIELPLGFFAFGTFGDPVDFKAENGHVVSGIFQNVQGVVRNDAFQREADLYSFGFNANYEGSNGWNAWADLGYSRTDRSELILESYSGTGYGVDRGATDSIGFISTTRGSIFKPTLNYSDPNLIKLTDPLGWGGSRVQAGYFNNRLVDDELMQVRAELERELNGGFLSAVKIGGSYNDRTKELTPDESFLALASGTQEVTLPEEYRLRPTNLSYLNLGPILSYNPLDLLANGIYRLDPNAVQDVFAKGYTVDEKLITLYAQADIEAEMGASTLTGNIGVQAVHTDQQSSGFTFLAGAPSPITLGDKYWDILPSLNLSMRFPSDFIIRFAAAREIQRPRLDQMRVSISYGVDRGGPTPIIRGDGGNPFLRPFRANGFDLNFEKYFGRSGYIALQLFYKDLKNFIYDNVEGPFDYTGFSLSQSDQVGLPSRIGTIKQPRNTGGGSMYGAEAAATLPFGVIAQALDGFGITGGLAYTKTSVRETPGGDRTQILGYSKWVANGTGFYEQDGFNVRGSVRHRSSFLGELSGFGGNRTNRKALGETIVDAQIGYDFQPGSRLEGLSLYLQGQNLTDERFATVTAPDRPLEVIDYQIYGRRFLAGATYKF
jgi:iron complex outermembrane receptor protein